MESRRLTESRWSGDDGGVVPGAKSRSTRGTGLYQVELSVRSRQDRVELKVTQLVAGQSKSVRVVRVRDYPVATSSARV